MIISKPVFKLTGVFLLLIAILFVPLLSQQTQEPIASGEITVKGVTLTVDPVNQTVPLNTATSVNTILSVENPEVLAGMVVKGTLWGPGLSEPITLSALPNHPFSIPGLNAKGTFTLDNIHLEKNGQTLLIAGTPKAIIEVMDIIVTKVETRLLSLEEMKEKGINITDKNFTAYNFSIGMQINSNEVKYQFPVVYAGEQVFIPTTTQTPSSGGLLGPRGKEPIPFILDLDLPENSAKDREKPTTLIPGVLIFNNDIAFLNQFFSIMFIISNSAPDGSPINLKDLKAQINLPTDALREAETTPPHIIGTPVPVRSPGPDGKIGTADDLEIIMATFSGMAEFLAEGLKQGSHTVEVDFSGTLSGLPGGDIPIKGSAKGTVIVRNPEFAVTFAHPGVVRVGEEYDIHVTISNTSPVDANLVTLAMPAAQLEGTEIMGEDSASFTTIKPGESETAIFHMRSLQNGRVRATAIDISGGLNGKIVLTAGVGEKDIPLSPDTLVLPSYAYHLPHEIINITLIALGEAYSIATTPAGGLPEHLPVITPEIIKQRVIDVAEAGQRIWYTIDLNETPDPQQLLESLQVLALDWTGNRHPDISFDILRRLTTKGSRWADEITKEFDKALASTNAPDFQMDFATACAYKKPFMSAALSFNGSRKAQLKISDYYSNRISVENGEKIRQIPYGELYSMHDNQGFPVDFALIGHLDEQGYTIEVLGQESGNFNLSFIVPDGTGGLNQVRFNDIPCQPGSRSYITINSGDSSFLMQTLPGDGSSATSHTGTVQQVPVPPLQLLSAIQDCTPDSSGHVVALLFNRKVTNDSATNTENYITPGKKVHASFLQASGRVVLVGLDNPISPFVESTITVSNLEDVIGGIMSPNNITLPVKATIRTKGGIVMGSILNATGEPIANAKIQLFEQEMDSLISSGLTSSTTSSDASGKYQFDFVRMMNVPFELHATDPNTGKKEVLLGKITVHKQMLRLDIVMRGRGSISGQVLNIDGSPASGAIVQAIAENAALGEHFGAQCDDQGQFLVDNLPLGLISLTAAKYASRGSQSTSLNFPGENKGMTITLVNTPTGTVSGVVFEKDGTTPAADIAISIAKVSNGQETFLAHTKTDAAGTFIFNNIPTGNIVITPFNPKTNRNDRKVYDTVVENQETHITLIFKGTATIKGTVTIGITNTPLNLDTTKKIMIYIPNSNYFTNPDEESGFILEDVPIGSHTLTAVNMETGQLVSAAANIYYEGQQIEINLNFPEMKEGLIIGTVTGPTGVPLDGATVVVTDGNYSVKASTKSSAGTFRFDNLPYGNYYVYATAINSAGTQNATVSSATPQNCNIQLRARGNIAIKVVAANGSTPVMATVTANYTIFTFIQQNFIGFEQYQETLATDENGEILLEDILYGNYTIKAQNPFYPLGATQSGSLDQAVENVVLQMPETGSIKVQVTGTRADENGDLQTVPINDVKLTLKTPTLSNRSNRTTTVTTTLQDGSTITEEGICEFTLVPTGPFTIEAEDDIDSLRVGVINGDLTGSTHADVTLKLKEYRSVKVWVSKRDSSGIPVIMDIGPGSYMRLNNQNFPYKSFNWPNDSGVSGDNGQSVTFNRVTEGTFFILLHEASTGLGGRYSGSFSGSGDTIEVTVPLEHNGSIVGQVVAADHITPVPNALVTLIDTNTGQVLASLTAGGLLDEEGNDNDQNIGTFQFPYLSTGQYKIAVTDPATGGNANQWVTLSSDGQQLETVIYLKGRGSVTGTFYDTDGSTVDRGGIEISLSNKENPASEAIHATTNQAGVFTFAQIGTGDFEIFALDPKTHLMARTTGQIDYDGQEVNAPLYAVPYGSVKGSIYTNDGSQPIGGAAITLKSSGYELITSSIVIPENGLDTGEFIIDYVPIGNFTLSVKYDRQYANTGGTIANPNQEVDLGQIPLSGFGTVQVTVVDGLGTPKAGINVKIISNYETYDNLATDSSGMVSKDQLRPGLFTAYAQTADGLLSAHGSGTVTANETTPITLTFQEAGIISGIVYRTNPETGQDEVFAGAYLELTPTGSSKRYLSSGADGSFRYEAVRLGDFVLDVTTLDNNGKGRRYGNISISGQHITYNDIRLDNGIPQVTTITPADNSAAVAFNTPIIVGFSESIDTGTVNNQSLQLSTPQGNITTYANWRSWDAENKTLTFTNPNGWQGSTYYTFTITPAVQDLAGNGLAEAVSVSFGTIDNVPPMVTSVVPAHNATGIGILPKITVTFSEPLNDSFGSANLTLGQVAGALVNGTIENDGTGMVYTFTPIAGLAENSSYEIQVSGATDRFGNVQSGTQSFTFTTIDTLAPVFSDLIAGSGGSPTEGTSLTLKATFSTGDTEEVYFFINGQAAAVTGTPANNFAIPMTIPMVAESGDSLLLEAKAIDFSGNMSDMFSKTVTITQDSPPTIAIAMIDPSTPQVFPGQPMTFNVTAHDANQLKRVAYFIHDGSNETETALYDQASSNDHVNDINQDITFTVPTAMASGSQMIIRAEAVDTLNNTASQRLVISADGDGSSSQFVSFITPTSGTLVFNGENLKLQTQLGKINDVTAIAFKVDGTTVHTSTRATLSDPLVETATAVVVDGQPGTEISYEVEVNYFDGSESAGTTDIARTTVMVVDGFHLSDGTIIAADDPNYQDGSQTVIISSGTVIINGSHRFKNILVKETGTLSHSSTGDTGLYKMHLTTVQQPGAETVSGKIVVGPNAGIDVDGRGYPGGHSGSGTNYRGWTYGDTVDTGATGSPQVAGGSHGGSGGQFTSNTTTYFATDTYGMAFAPNLPGSGGGGSATTSPGGNGGGVIAIDAPTLILDGHITANGNNRQQTGGSGAGGSIFLDVTTIKGSGSVQANGGSSTDSAGGAGGGGRIALYYQDAETFHTESIIAYGGSYNGTATMKPEYNGAAGTVFLKQTENAGSLDIDNGGKDSSQTSTLGTAGTISELFGGNRFSDTLADFMIGKLVGMKLVILPNSKTNTAVTFTITANDNTSITVATPTVQLTDVADVGDKYQLTTDALISLNDTNIQLKGSTVIADITLDNTTLLLDGSLEGNSITLQNGSLITHSGSNVTELDAEGNVSTPASTSALHLKASTINIDNTSRIDVSSLGYLGAFKGNNPTQYGMTLGNINGSRRYSGGSHGGYGGQGFNDDGGAYKINDIYGSFTQPVDPGSGGAGNGTATPGGNGGGVIRLETGLLQLEGEIFANGGNGQNESGGGAGGSIWIDADTITGSGSIQANGGTTHTNVSLLKWGEGGGSGGRIALHYQDSSQFDLANVTAYGGRQLDSQFDLQNKFTLACMNGNAGTIYMAKTNQEPQLVIDNNGINTYKSLIFPEITPAAVAEINSADGDGKTITDNTWAFLPGSLKDVVLTVTHDDGSGNKSTSDYTIVANIGTKITVDRAGIELGDTFTHNIVFDGKLIIRGAYVQISREIHLGSLSLENNATLSHPGCTIDKTHFLFINATGNVSIDNSSSIDTTNKGYLGGYSKDPQLRDGSKDNNTATGLTAPGVNGAVLRTGGTHGGSGGRHNWAVEGPPNVLGDTYGSLYEPILPGAGSGGADLSDGISIRPGSNGGGAVHIKADQIILDGQILANGGNNPYKYPSLPNFEAHSGGAGGSIFLDANSISGTGTMTASGSYGHFYIPSGGGGRIAMHYGSNGLLLNMDNVQAFGGKSTYYTLNRTNGGAGTIYLKDNTQTQGSLLVNNNNIDTNDWQPTELPPIEGGIHYLLDLTIKGHARLLTIDIIQLPSGVDPLVEDGSTLDAANYPPLSQ
jgi:Bacterial Ig-like domain/Carboxypeptidase regulatory-like domain